MKREDLVSDVNAQFVVKRVNVRPVTGRQKSVEA